MTHYSPERIFSIAIDVSGVDILEVVGHRRHPDIVKARRNIAYAIRKLTRAGYVEIAQTMGRASHSSVHAQVRIAAANGGPEFVERVKVRLAQ